jgi:hypothetical protein
MRRRWGLVCGAALAFAAGWSLLLLVLAFVVPVYTTSTQSASVAGAGVATSTETVSAATIVQVNGLYVVMLLCIPLGAAALVSLLLRYAEHRDAVIGAFLVAVLFAAFCVVGLMSVGLFMLPAAIALLVACATARPEAMSEQPPSGAFATPKP